MTNDDLRDAGDEGERDAADLIERGADLAGALAGGALSLVGGPLGALGGAALGVAVKHAASAVAERLSARQRVRAGAALALIAEEAQEHRERGEAPRDDGFFDERDGLRPEAEEVLEAVLMQAANAYEERKVPLLARLYDSVAHSPDVSAADAHHLLKLADRLTYRQLVTLAVVADEDRHGEEIAYAAAAREVGDVRPTASLDLEVDALGESGVIGVVVDGYGPHRVAEVIGSAGTASQHGWGALRLLEAGWLLHRLMGLDSIPDDDRARLLAELNRASPAA